MIAKRLLAAATLALFVGCKDSTAPANPEGSFSFTYSGGISGDFDVTGAMPSTPGAQETSSWAAGEVVAGGTNAGIYVVAMTPRTSTTHDFVVLIANRTNAGAATIDFDNCTAAVCSTVDFVFGIANGNGTGFLQICYLQTGTITITEVTETHLRGTFSGAGTCTAPSQTETSLTVTNGTFDVPIVPGSS